MTVTILRSASGAAGGGEAVAPMLRPQESQNRALGLSEAPQAAHTPSPGADTVTSENLADPTSDAAANSELSAALPQARLHPGQPRSLRSYSAMQ